jgi:hypothetical protein
MRKLAEDRGVSVNFLTSKALQRFVEWDSFAEKFGFVDLPASMVAKMMEYLSEDQMRTLGRWMGGQLLREYVLFWFKEVSLATVLEAFPRLVAKHGRIFEFEDHQDSSSRTIIIKHGRGPKISIFYVEVLSTALDKLLGIKAKIESTDNQVVARFLSGSFDPDPRLRKLS